MNVALAAAALVDVEDLTEAGDERNRFAGPVGRLQDFEAVGDVLLDLPGGDRAFFEHLVGRGFHAAQIGVEIHLARVVRRLTLARGRRLQQIARAIRERLLAPQLGDHHAVRLQPVDGERFVREGEVLDRGAGILAFEFPLPHRLVVEAPAHVGAVGPQREGIGRQLVGIHDRLDAELLLEALVADVLGFDAHRRVAALDRVLGHHGVGLLRVARVLDVADLPLDEQRRGVGRAVAFGTRFDAALVAAQIVDDLIGVLPEFVEHQDRPAGVFALFAVRGIPRIAVDGAHVLGALGADVAPFIGIGGEGFAELFEEFVVGGH